MEFDFEKKLNEKDQQDVNDYFNQIINLKVIKNKNRAKSNVSPFK